MDKSSNFTALIALLLASYTIGAHYGYKYSSTKKIKEVQTASDNYERQLTELKSSVDFIGRQYGKILDIMPKTDDGLYVEQRPIEPVENTIKKLIKK